MEGCPADNYIPLFLILSAFTGVFIVFLILTALNIRKSYQRRKVETKRDRIKNKDKDFHDLQVELYGVQAMHRFEQRKSDDTTKLSPGDESPSEESNDSGDENV